MANTQLQQNDALSWSKWVTDFDKTFSTWTDTYKGLANLKTWLYQSHPELVSQYTSLMTKGAADLVKLQDLKNTRDVVANWLQSIGYAIGNIPQAISGAVTNVENAAGSAIDWLKARFGLSGLSAIPIIVIGISLAAAIAAIAVIAANATQAYNIYIRWEAMKNAEARGASPQQAANIASQMTPDHSAPLLGIGGVDVGKFIWIGLGLLALPSLMQAFSRSKSHG